jgi:hypothetical protein
MPPYLPAMKCTRDDDACGSIVGLPGIPLSTHRTPLPHKFIHDLTWLLPTLLDKTAIPPLLHHVRFPRFDDLLLFDPIQPTTAPSHRHGYPRAEWVL